MESHSNERPLLFAFWLMLVAALWSWSISWNGSMLDSHIFRQTQTAISAHWMKQDGFRLDYETPLFGPPWSLPLEFPAYQWCMVQLCRVTGLPLEQSGRATSVLFFLATLPAVYLLAGLAGLARGGRLLVVACALSCPIYLYYGRSVMIETAGLCFSAWFLVATGLAVRGPSLCWSTVATIGGTLAALTKVTTFILYCFPAAALALWFIWPHWKSRGQSAAGWWRALLLGGAPVPIAAATGAWWVRHADAVKDSNPFSHFLTSAALMSWNWGTLDERLSPAFWQEFWRDLSQCVMGEPAFAVLLVCLISIAGWWRRWALVGVVGFVLGPLIFSNLYYRHDYYYCANSLLLMTGAGFLLAGMWSTSLLPRGVKVMLLALFLGSQLLTFYRGLAYNYRRALPRPPEIADVIRQTVSAEDVVLIYGWDWNSLIPYYAQRRAILVPNNRELETDSLDQIVAKLPPHGIRAMLVHRETFDAPAAFIEQRTARFGLASVPFAASTDGELYLPKEVSNQFRKQLVAQKYQYVTFPAEPGAASRETDRRESDLSEIEPSLVSPKASRSSSLFGISRGDVDKRPVLNAHAPAEIWINSPPGATHLTAEFGLHEGAYTGRPPFTDGIGVTISELRSGSPPRVLFRRELDPVRKPADRGIQKIELTGAEAFTGQLLFQFDPGPEGKIEKDWAYWARIEIR